MKNEWMVTFDALVDVGQAVLAVFISAGDTFAVNKHFSVSASSLAFSIVELEFSLAFNTSFVICAFITFRITFSASTL
jgi:hypothetical protein